MTPLAEQPASGVKFAVAGAHDGESSSAIDGHGGTRGTRAFGLDAPRAVTGASAVRSGVSDALQVACERLRDNHGVSGGRVCVQARSMAAPVPASDGTGSSGGVRVSATHSARATVAAGRCVYPRDGLDHAGGDMQALPTRSVTPRWRRVTGALSRNVYALDVVRRPPVSLGTSAAVEAVPGEHTFRRDRVCACGAELVWEEGPLLRIRCSVCQLVHYVRPRSVPTVWAAGQLAVLVAAVAAGVSDKQWGWVGAGDVNGHVAWPAGVRDTDPLRVDDYRWCSVVLAGGHNDSVVYIARFGVPVAWMAVPLARWLRVVCLQQLSRHGGVATEADVHVYLLQWLLVAQRCGAKAVRVPAVFPGDTHVFQPQGFPCEAATVRCAALPSATAGQQWYLGRGVSAYCDVAAAAVESGGVATTLSAEAHGRMFGDHALGPFMTASIRVGFPLLAERVPVVPRSDRSAATSSAKAVVDTARAVAAEVSAGAFVRIDKSVLACEGAVLRRTVPYFAVPKDGGAGVRGIANLSAGTDSVNSWTVRPRALLGAIELASWDAVAARILYMKATRPGARVVCFKLDVARAFRHVPLAVRDRWLLLHRCGGSLVGDLFLPMGDKLSCDYMCCLSNAVGDIASARYGLFTASFVDDQLAVVYEDEAVEMVAALKGLWAGLGWQLNEAKFLMGGQPATSIVFLGVNICTEACTASVTSERMASLAAALTAATARESMPSQELVALCGRLSFVATVVPHGRALLRACYKAAAGGGAKGQRCECAIDGDVRFELEWWKRNLPRFNGAATFADASGLPVLTVATDAASHGFGGVCEARSEFFCGRWGREETLASSVNHWELAVVVFAATVWGACATGGVLRVMCDNTSAVAVATSYRARDDGMRNLLYALVSLQLEWGFRLVVDHIPGVLNCLPDRLSRGGQIPETSSRRWRKVVVPVSTRRCGRSLLSECHTAQSQDLRSPTPVSLTGSTSVRRWAFPSTVDVGTVKPVLWPVWQRRAGARC